MAEVVPPLARLAFWGAAGAFVSLELYRLLSPQRKIRAVQLQLSRLRGELKAYGGEFAGACLLMGRQLRAACTQVVLVTPAALVASLPLLCLIVWISTAYSYQFPQPGRPVPVHVEETDHKAFWQEATNEPAPQVVITNASGRPVAKLTVSAPIPILHKRQWWNTLIGNPAGYLSKDAPVQRVEIGLPRTEVLAIGPGWLRGWEPTFFATLLVASLLLKFTRQIA